MTSRLFDPVSVEEVVTALERRSENSDRIEWAEHHDPFVGSGEMVDGLATPRAVVGDVGCNGFASGWEFPELGRSFAYYEVISLIRNQALSFGVPLDQIGLDDIDPERDLL